METGAAIRLLGRSLGLVVVASTALLAQATPPDALVTLLRQGGYVLVMRHASSPREVPTKQSANPDNTKLERQLDDAGRSAAKAMGEALRDLNIPIGEVLTSPTYRALETIRIARFPAPKPYQELGDGGQSMQTATDAQGAWLRERITHVPKGTNTLIVTHMPNLASAFPEWGAVADGESVIVGSDRKGGVRVAGRIKIEEWSRFHTIR